MDRARIERIKTWVLIALAMMSVYLTAKIWFIMPTPGQVTETPGDSGINQNANIIGSLAPEKIIIDFGNGSYTLLLPGSGDYSDIWAAGQDALVQAAAKAPGADSGGRKPGDGPLVEMVFKTPVDTDLWCKLFDGKSRSGDGGFLVKSILLDVEHGLVFLQDPDGKTSAATVDFSGYDSEKLFKALESGDYTVYRRLSDVTAGLPADEKVFVPVGDVNVPRVIIRQEGTPPEKFARKFFPDMSIVRKIEEKDGATIYTDGRSGLRIYKDGAVEYTHTSPPPGGNGTELFESMSISDMFISTHGGWPPEIYLDGIKAGTNSGPEGLTFIYNCRFFGIPVIGAKNAVEISVNGGMVVSYYKNFSCTIQQTGEQIPIIDAASAVEAVMESYDVLMPQNDRDRKISDMYIAYYLSGNDLGEPLPVWVVQLGSVTVFVNATNGHVFTAVN